MIRFTVENPPKFNLNWWEPTQKEWAPELLKEQKPFWHNEQNPSNGRPWRKRKEPTGDWPLLHKTGKMQDTAKILPEGKGFMVSTTDYGPYQQFGTSKMVARPWMGIPEKSMATISSIAWKNILSN